MIEIRWDARLAPGVLEFWQSKALDAFDCLEKAKEEHKGSLGWLDPLKWASPETLSHICGIASAIRDRDEVFALIGVGGSNNGARAAIQALGQAKPKVVYAGCCLSPLEMNRALGECVGKSFSVNAIAKSFETLEPGLGFRAFRQLLERQFDLDPKRLILTGSRGTRLEEIANELKCEFLEFPEDVGGRFSVLTNVGLLPMAAAGVDICAMVQGAIDIRGKLETARSGNPAILYAGLRNALCASGCHVELFAFFEPALSAFGGWLAQLFGESEGKEGKGLLPIYAAYSEGLHSLGQFVQQGSPILFETFLDFDESPSSFMIQPDRVADGFSYIDGLELSKVNRAAFEATYAAHSERIPCARIKAEKMDAYNFGQLLYFFEFSCFLSALALGVNPFDQPGVEAYKKRMFEYIRKYVS
jgi:glucose-6-phosphate isomerase